jgi:hypothetical protein
VRRMNLGSIPNRSNKLFCVAPMASGAQPIATVVGLAGVKVCRDVNVTT